MERSDSERRGNTVGAGRREEHGSAASVPATAPGPVLSWRLVPVGVVRTPFSAPLTTLKHFERVGRATLEVFPEFEAALKDIDGFSHLWLLTLHAESGDYQPDLLPREGRSIHGLFATRSPRRPNPIGLFLVELVGREGRFLRVHGAHVRDGTPLLDIRPYLPGEDWVRNARCGWMAQGEASEAGELSTSKETPPRK
ncbi:MAG: tRNA (N6-threonylcarbamoyladenosine(37)-N6)-methyltransferase TrmO [Acidobacteriota bacterium]